MNATTETAAHSTRLQTVIAKLQAAWQGLPTIERRVMASGGVAAVALMLALAMTCQESVQRGERFRAEQRQMA